MLFITALFGWILAISSTFVWIGYSIYQTIKTDLGFFEIVLPNIGFWVLQTVIGVLLVGISLSKTLRK
jgi:hypothetical protein